MVQIQNTDAINAIRNGARLSISEGYPQDLGKTCVPVMDMTPHFHRFSKFATLNRVVTGSGTILTFHATRETFITGIAFSVVKDATCDAATGNVPVNIAIDGTNVSIVSFSIVTLTAEQHDMYVQLKNPIKVDKGSIAYLPATYTAGLMSRTATIHYYEVD